MRSLGNNPTIEELEELIEDADRDGPGSVDFQEVVELMIKREAEKETQEDLKQVFRVFDKVDLYLSLSSGSLARSIRPNFVCKNTFFLRMGMDLCQLQKSSLSCPRL